MTLRFPLLKTGSPPLPSAGTPAALLLAALIGSGCTTVPSGAPTPVVLPPVPPTAPAPAASPVRPASPDREAPPAAAKNAYPAAPRASTAGTPREYRKDAAAHLYHHNGHRIFRGRLPAYLYAVGVLEVQIDRNGHVASTHWLRAPRHAPEVVAEIERTVRAAAPFPAPGRMGKVTYTDTWLWDKSGRFQLDTLTEGQD